MAKRRIFFITPIGEENSEARKRANNVQKHFLQRALGTDFDILRADQIDKPGSITKQVIGLLIDCDLVVADITTRNPNVLYELGVRHAVNRPTVTLCSKDEKLPFDIADQRTIFYDLSDMESHAETIERIKRSAKNLEHYISPVAEVGLRTDQKQADVLDILSDILDKVDSIESDMFLSSLDDDIDNAKDEIVKEIQESRERKIDFADLLWEYKREVSELRDEIYFLRKRGGG